MTGTHDGFRNLLAVLGDDAREADAVLARAVALAEEAHGTLTLAAMGRPAWCTAWLIGLAAVACVVPPLPDAPDDLARDRLARAAEFVPAGVSVTTLVLRESPRRGLHRLVATGRYDLVVVGAHLAAFRRLARLPVPALVVRADPRRGEQPARLSRPESHPLLPGSP